MKKSEFKQLIREELSKVLNEETGMWVIYAEQNGTKKEINRVPLAKLNTALQNIGARYMDDMGVTIAAMSEGDWAKSVNEVEITGDFNDMDFPGPAKKAAAAYLKTPEGMKAAKIFKSLVTNQFDAVDLENAIKAGKFKKTNDFKAAAKAGGLELSGLGNVDNQGNGDFEVLNRNYTDQGAAITFFSNKFYSVG